MTLSIDQIRKSIDEIDSKILELLTKRKDFIREISIVKNKLSLTILDEKREKEVLQRLTDKAEQSGLNKEFVNNLFDVILENSRFEQCKQSISFKCNIKKIGLIGFGRFGELIIKHLSSDFKFYVYDQVDKNEKIRKNSAIPSSLKGVCQKDIIVLAVPISELGNILKNIKNLLKKDSTVMDVCSVKEYPVKLMKNMLSKNVQILATHPMFGPDTASDSLYGRKIAMCKVRINDGLYTQIKEFFESKGLIVIETTSEEHDKEIAKSLILTHLIGRALVNMRASNVDMDTQGYRNLVKILDTVKNDTWQLFKDMNNFNRFSKDVRDGFLKSIKEINSKLK